MKLAILHHDIEWVEPWMKKTLEEKNHEVHLHDVRDTEIETLEEYDCIINRVYASVANRDCESNKKTLQLLEKLEEQGILCINSFTATKYDYSKYLSYLRMKDEGILTPETIFLKEEKNSIEKAKEFAKEKGYPLILKRDVGGRGKDVQKIDNEQELEEKIINTFKEAGQYNQGFILQEFIKSSRPHDCRIAIVDGSLSFSYSRSLIPTKEGGIAWLASVSRGSNSSSFKPEKQETELAIKATQSIDALFNEADITFTEKGPLIIENNPTPNYVQGCKEDEGRLRNAITLIERKILEKKTCQEKHLQL